MWRLLLLALALPATAAAQGLPPGSTIAEPSPPPRLHLNLTSRGGTERGAFLVAYGHVLFNSPEILGPKARALGMSCATCHPNGDVNRDLFVSGLSARKGGIDVTTAFFDGAAENGIHDPVDIPSLRGVRLTGPYGRDGRIASLREFVAMVIVTEFGGAEPTTLMLDALTAFLNQLDFLPAPFLDRRGVLNARAPEAAKRGEELFDAHCASCHKPNAYFTDGLRHDVGSGGGFDTPTLLGAAHTAPYMHDGSLATLGDVVAFFDEKLKLALSAGEKSDLAAYLEAVGTAEEPFDRGDPGQARARDTATFASTLETLIARRDRFHAMLLIRSLAPTLDRIGEAILAEDWDEARKRSDAWRAANEPASRKAP
jgi:cytochrome c peroxidase